MLEKCKNLPENLKVLCYTDDEENICQINFPIGLKYLLIKKNLRSDIVNKIKLPFGCKFVRV